MVPIHTALPQDQAVGLSFNGECLVQRFSESSLDLSGGVKHLGTEQEGRIVAELVAGGLDAPIKSSLTDTVYPPRIQFHPTDNNTDAEDFSNFDVDISALEWTPFT